MCPDALYQVQECVQAGKPMMDYVPDFTCKVVEDARILRIKLSDFKACIQGKFDDFDHTTVQGRSSRSPRSPRSSHKGDIPGRGRSEPARLWRPEDAENQREEDALSGNEAESDNEETSILIPEGNDVDPPSSLRYSRSHNGKK